MILSPGSESLITTMFECLLCAVPVLWQRGAKPEKEARKYRKYGVI